MRAVEGLAHLLEGVLIIADPFPSVPLADLVCLFTDHVTGSVERSCIAYLERGMEAICKEHNALVEGFRLLARYTAYQQRKVRSQILTLNC